MTLHPEAVAVLERIAAEGAPPYPELSPTEARRVYDAAPDFTAAPETLEEVWDDLVRTESGEVPVRIYRPRESSGGAVVYLHGGGWVLGSIDAVDSPVRALARRSGAVVCSIGYRLAPETPFPGALEDSYTSLAWLAARSDDLGIDDRRIVIAGDSAGGNLAAAAALLTRRRGGPEIAGQVLLYPVLDCDFTTASYLAHADGYGLTRASMRWYWDHYAPGEARLDPLASPLREPDLEGLPQALIATAEHDPLRDEGEAYAHRLEAAGVPVTLRRYEGMIHGFFRMAGVIAAGQRLVDDVGAWIGSLERIVSA